MKPVAMVDLTIDHLMQVRAHPTTMPRAKEQASQLVKASKVMEVSPNRPPSPELHTLPNPLKPKMINQPMEKKPKMPLLKAIRSITKVKTPTNKKLKMKAKRPTRMSSEMRIWNRQLIA